MPRKKEDKKYTLARLLAKLRAERDIVSKQYRDLTKEIDELQETLVNVMGKEQKFTHVDIGTVSISSSIRPKIANWDQFWKWIKRRNFSHMVEQRPSVSGFKELYEQNKPTPGLEAFEKKTIRITKAN